MPVDVKVPPLGESIVEATVGRWLKKQGETVTSGEALVELETDKVNIEVASPDGGVLTEVLAEEGATVNVGDTIGRVDAVGTAPATAGAPAAEGTPAAPATQAQEAAAPAAPKAPPAQGGGVAGPHVRRMATEKGVDIASLQGSGPRGRVTEEDVLQAAAPTAAAVPAAPAAPAPPVAPPAEGSEERIPMSRRRRTIAARLLEAKQATAMLTTFNEVDMTAIMEARAGRKEAFREAHGVSLGFMSFFTRAVVSGLKAFPRLNAEISGTDIILKHHYDIGVAVSTEEGLVVPVLRSADQLTFAGIEAGIADLARKAREGKLTLEDLRGGTFTITNGGVFGSLLSTPILNHPEVGILGMHTIQERPVAVRGQVEVHPMMYVALSYDHRIVDGSEAVRFLVHVKKLLEDPVALLLES